MRKLILVVFAIIGLVSFVNAQNAVNRKDANGLKQGGWIGRYPDGTIRYSGSYVDDRPVGDWLRFYENGKVKAHLFYFPNNGKTSAKLFDSNGALFATGNYINMVKDSTWNYYDNQKLVGKEDLLGGIKNGKSLAYFEDGKVANETSWANGELDGVSRTFYSTGNIKSEIMYRGGKQNGLSIVYYESGQQEIIGHYVNDEADGTWTYKDENGLVKYELKYKNGILLNPGAVDSIQAKEFKSYDRAKGVLKDPANFIEDPQGYIGK